jgi:hypothetical protein
MKNGKLWLGILIGGATIYYLTKILKKNNEKNFYGFVDEDTYDVASELGGGNRGKGTKVEPRPSDEPVYTKRGKGRS